MKNRPRWPSCQFCGMQFSKRSMAIHQKQCIRKMEQKIDTLPPDIRNRILNRHKVKKTAGRRKKRRGQQQRRERVRKGGGRFEEVESNSWLEDSASNGPVNLIPCKFCGRTFFLDRIQKHEKVCTERKEKKRRVFNSLKQRIHEEVSQRHVRNEKKKDLIRKKRGIRKARRSKWREQHREFIKNIREAKRWEMSQRNKRRTEGHRFSGGRSSGYGGGGGGGIQVFAPKGGRVPRGGGGGFGGGRSYGGGFSTAIGTKMSGTDLSRYRTARSYGGSSRRSQPYSGTRRQNRSTNVNRSRRNVRSTSNRTSTNIRRPKTSGLKKRRVRRTVAPTKSVKRESQIKTKPRMRSRNTRKYEEPRNNPMTQSLDEVLLMKKVSTSASSASKSKPKKKTRRIGKKKVLNRTTGGEGASLSSSLSFFGTRASSDMYATSSSSYGDWSPQASGRTKVAKKKTVRKKKSGYRPRTSGGVRRSRY